MIDEDWYDTSPDYEGKTEPDCMNCWDTGITRGARPWESPTFTRVRAARARCADCNPSPRQRRRWPLHLRRLQQQFERDRRRNPGLNLLAFDDEAPF